MILLLISAQTGLEQILALVPRAKNFCSRTRRSGLKRELNIVLIELSFQPAKTGPRAEIFGPRNEGQNLLETRLG